MDLNQIRYQLEVLPGLTDPKTQHSLEQLRQIGKETIELLKAGPQVVEVKIFIKGE